MIDDADRLVPVTEAARLLGVKERTLRAWLSFRRLPHVKLGRRAVRIPLSALQAFIKLRTIRARVEQEEEL
jgi:excisionase family DNA binding protein